MSDTLGWKSVGEVFQDGSRLEDWTLIEKGTVWHWQYDTHELTFDIFAHDGQFWKLYRARMARADGEYMYDFGGQACRMVQVSYIRPSRSPHSRRAMQPGDVEWVRTYEFNSEIHQVLKTGKTDEKYGKPFEDQRAA